MLTMVEEVVQYCLTMFAAVVMNHTYGIVSTSVDGIMTYTAIGMVVMQVLIATDIRYSILDCSGLNV